MKKTLNFISIAVVALSLVSCGNDKKSNSETDVKLEDHQEQPMQMEEVDDFLDDIVIEYVQEDDEKMAAILKI